MLPRSRKLSASEVREILRMGKPTRGSRLLAKYREAPLSKAAVVVSKKVAKSAVERNKIRRELYAALVSALPQGKQVVFTVTSGGTDLVADITTLCSKLS